MIKAIARLCMGVFDRRRRRLDMAILWPACCHHAPTLDEARAAFALHVYRDPAWTRHYGHDELYEFINGMIDTRETETC